MMYSEALRIARLPMLICVIMALSGCVSTPPGLYVGGVRQPEGPVALSGLSTFRFVDKWRISHVWVQGSGIVPCRYPDNIFKKLIPGYPKLAAEEQTPFFGRGEKVYFANVLPRAPKFVYFYELVNQIQGEMPNGFEPTGYTPFCSQAFLPASPNGMGLSIVKPDPQKGTDEWIRDAEKVKVNGLTWSVRRVPAAGKVEDSIPFRTMEFWTLKIPGTSYWMNLEFNGNRRSVTLFAGEHARLLDLFHQVIESIQLEPITPVSPQDMPPFVDKYGQPIRDVQ